MTYKSDNQWDPLADYGAVPACKSPRNQLVFVYAPHNNSDVALNFAGL